MTREHKLALIVGFSLILVVGVLISDHVSSTTRSELPDFGHDEAPVPVALAPATIEPEPPAQVAIRELEPEPEPEPLVELHFGRPAPDTRTEEAAPAARGPILASNSTGAPADDPTLVERVREFGGRVVERAGRGDVDLPTLAQTSQGRQEPNGRPSEETTTATARPTEPEAPTRWHTVERGQSLYTISQRYYGSGRHWRQLAEVNQDRVGDNGTVRQGVRLRIPETLNGTTIVASEATPAEPATASRPATTREYTVQPGDTLGVISQRLLGTVRRTEEIVRLNSSVIQDADDIRVGMVLKLPAS